MGIALFHSFTVEAEVLGKLRAVEYRNGVLTFGALTVAEAAVCIDRVAGAVTEDVRIEMKHEETLVGLTPGTSQSSPAPAVIPLVTATSGMVTVTVPTAVVSKAEEPARAAKPGKPSLDEARASMERKRAKVDAEIAAKAESAPVPATCQMSAVTLPVDDAALVVELNQCSKLRDVVGVLQRHGVGEEPAIIAACERLRDQVNVLKVIPDVPGRVRRTLVALSGITA